MRALIVDDSRAMRSILSDIMQECGFETLEAADGRAALDCLAASDGVAVALVDWNMPVMDGYEFVRTVRNQPAHDTVILMMVTSETEMAQVKRALQAGANEYVMKPFTKEVILEKLALLGMGAQ